MVGMALAGLWTLFGSRLPGLACLPDVFVAFFFAEAQRKLQLIIPDDAFAVLGSLILFMAIAQASLMIDE